MIDLLGKTVEETGDKLIATKSKYNNNKQNMVIFYTKLKKYNEIQLTKNKMDLNDRKMTIIHPPLRNRERYLSGERVFSHVENPIHPSMEVELLVSHAWQDMVWKIIGQQTEVSVC